MRGEDDPSPFCANIASLHVASFGSLILWFAKYQCPMQFPQSRHHLLVGVPHMVTRRLASGERDLIAFRTWRMNGSVAHQYGFVCRTFHS